MSDKIMSQKELRDQQVEERKQKFDEYGEEFQAGMEGYMGKVRESNRMKKLAEKGEPLPESAKLYVYLDQWGSHTYHLKYYYDPANEKAFHSEQEILDFRTENDRLMKEFRSKMLNYSLAHPITYGYYDDGEDEEW